MEEEEKEEEEEKCQKSCDPFVMKWLLTVKQGR